MSVKHAFVFCGQINWSLLYFLKAFAWRKNQPAYLLNFLNGIFLICHVPGSKIHIKLNFLLSFHTVLKRLVQFSMFLTWYHALHIWYIFGMIHCTYTAWYVSCTIQYTSYTIRKLHPPYMLFRCSSAFQSLHHCHTKKLRQCSSLRTIPAGANLLKQRSTACSVVMFCLTSTAYNYNKKHIYIKWWKLCV